MDSDNLPGWSELGDEDDDGWVVVQVGRERWRVVLPSAPAKGGTVAHALAGIELFAQARVSVISDRGAEEPARRAGGRLAGWLHRHRRRRRRGPWPR